MERRALSKKFHIYKKSSHTQLTPAIVPIMLANSNRRPIHGGTLHSALTTYWFFQKEPAPKFLSDAFDWAGATENAGHRAGQSSWNSGVIFQAVSNHQYCRRNRNPISDTDAVHLTCSCNIKSRVVSPSMDDKKPGEPEVSAAPLSSVLPQAAAAAYQKQLRHAVRTALSHVRQSPPSCRRPSGVAAAL